MAVYENEPDEVLRDDEDFDEKGPLPLKYNSGLGKKPVEKLKSSDSDLQDDDFDKKEPPHSPVGNQIKKEKGTPSKIQSGRNKNKKAPVQYSDLIKKLMFVLLDRRRRETIFLVISR